MNTIKKETGVLWSYQGTPKFGKDHSGKENDTGNRKRGSPKTKFIDVFHMDLET